MYPIVSRTEAFTHAWKITPDAIDMDSCCQQFLAEMEKGLRTRTASLAMIPTYTSADTRIEAGRSVIVLDAGGTNFRTCLVTFDEHLQPHLSSFRKSGMPGVRSEVSAKEFFSILADDVEPLIGLSDLIGFCFSYAAEITADHDGIPLVFSKEIKAPQVIGKPVGKALLEELARRGHDVSHKRVAVVNDTVATLLAGKAAAGNQLYSGFVGFILGTGTNTAYVESNANISKITLDAGQSQIINVESGNYDLVPGELDRRFMASTKHPDQYHFEKMISGAYLGGFSQLVIQQAIQEGLFSAGFTENLANVGTLDTARMSNYLEMPNNVDYVLVRCVQNEDDAIALHMILDAIISRAAKLTAVNLAAAVIKSGAGENPRYPVCINADGTTYYKTENLQRYTEQYLNAYLQREKHRYVRFVRIDDSPILGAAVAGLSLIH